MSYKVAVASSDGRVINQHFGRSRKFLIFEITDQSRWAFLENRDNVPPCSSGEHSEDDMERTIDLLSDCSIVLASRIGPGAEQKLSLRGIKSYSVPYLISDTLDKLVKFNKNKNNQHSVR
ncbi:hypothetical protein SDC9_167162 [bioreactor metagenome]|uniref:Dinitrogenase iron-molybdenum cofactor biosynthesis domain-containing protein n=1 Tax=bioreactor metagenome TaxID=1076179 RepID=A0A645G1M3_9ZZZZ|nr:NifB/NifX family molybdenum-iron cluster-binding protein [Syntrophomonadaceae bacterium]